MSTSFDVNAFLCFINSLYPTLAFTCEWESDSCIPFLDVLIIRSSTCLKFRVFRKPSHSNSYLHFFSFHPVSLKVSVAQGLFLRALRVCSPEFLSEELDFIHSSLSGLAYPSHILRKSLSKAKYSFFKAVPRQDATLPHSRVCVPFVPSLNTRTQSLLRSNLNCNLSFSYPNKIKSVVVSNAPKHVSSAGVYRVDCKDCGKFYIGESGRSLDVRIKEHKSDFRRHNLNNAMYVHSIDHNHSFDFNNAHLVFPCNDIHTRKVMESSVIRSFPDQVVNLNSGLSNVNTHIAGLVMRGVGNLQMLV